MLQHLVIMSAIDIPGKIISLHISDRHRKYKHYSDGEIFSNTLRQFHVAIHYFYHTLTKYESIYILETGQHSFGTISLQAIYSACYVLRKLYLR